MPRSVASTGSSVVLRSCTRPCHGWSGQQIGMLSGRTTSSGVIRGCTCASEEYIHEHGHDENKMTAEQADDATEGDTV